MSDTDKTVKKHDRYLFTYRKFSNACKHKGHAKPLDKKCFIDPKKIKKIVVGTTCQANSCPILRGIKRVSYE